MTMIPSSLIYGNIINFFVAKKYQTSQKTDENN